MKNVKIFISFILVILTSSFDYASQTRLDSFNAEGYIPDYEYDTININPAFLLDSDKIGISVYTGFENYKRSSTTSNEYMNSSTNISSMDSNNVSYLNMNPSFFINIPILTNLEIGLYYNPNINIEYSYYFSGSNQNYPYTYENTYNNSIIMPLSMDLFLGVKLGNIKACIEYSMIIMYNGSTNEPRDNGILDTNAYQIGDSSLSSYGGKAGALLNLGNIDLGASLGFNYSSVIINDPSYYYAPNNFFLAQDNSTGYNIFPTLFMQYKFDDYSTIRFVLDGRYSTYTKDTFFNKDNYLQIYPNSQDMLNNYKIQAVDNEYYGKISMSIFKGEPQFNLWFAGINIMGTAGSYTYSFNINQNPVQSGQKYISYANNQEISSSISTGFEGRVISVFIPRVGINLNLFDYTFNQNSVVDSYSDSALQVQDTTTVSNRTSQYTFFNNITLSAGLGYMPVENLLIEAGMNSFFSIGIYSQTDEPDLTQGVQPKETLSGYDIRLFLNVSCWF